MPTVNRPPDDARTMTGVDGDGNEDRGGDGDGDGDGREGATAFVPGHVTAFFSVHRTDDPATTGSRGAGLALSEGVRTTVEPAERTTVRLDGREASVPPVERVLDALGATATVRIRTDLPIGAGFGVSGGVTLGTALAATEALDRARSENEVIRAAHVAEVESDTGLGDVVAQARGGIPIRLVPGAPDAGRLDGLPARPRVEYVTFGEFPTESVIGGDVERLSAAGERALSRLREEPTLAQLFAAARTFAREADLLVPDVEAAIADVREAGGAAAMAMLGKTVVALGDGLSAAGYDPDVCRVHGGGATLVDGERGDDREAAPPG